MNNIVDFNKKLNIGIQDVKNELQHLLEDQASIHRLKDPEAAHIKISKQVDICFESFDQDINQVINDIIENIQDDEVESFGKFCAKIQSYLLDEMNIKERNVLVEDDFDLLDKIATRALSEDKYKESSSIYRLIIYFNPFFSRAWVGWAIAEQFLNHKDIVEEIYHLALICNPIDVFIVSYIVDYYLVEKKEDRAKQVIKNSLAIILENNIEDQEAILYLENLLKNIGRR